MSVWVTPTLLVGLEPSSSITTTLCHDAASAIGVIDSGGTVWLLPLPDWPTLAREILVGVGATPPWAARQVHAALTGDLRPEAAFE